MDLRVEQANDSVMERVGEWFRQQRRRLATIAVMLLVLPLAHHAIYGPNGWIAYGKKKTEYRQLQQELLQLQAQNEALERRVQSLREADPRAIEREAREQLRYAKPGEIVLVIPEQGQRQEASPAAGSQKP